MAKLRHAAPTLTLVNALQLAIELTVGNGGGSYTTTGVNAAYPTIPAGSYAFPEFVILVSQKIRQYIFDDFAAAGSLPTNVGTVEAKNIFINFTASQTWNATKCDFQIKDASCNIGGNPANITACTLKNPTASNQPGWPTVLGLGVENSDVACSISAGQATALGAFQPPHIFTFLRSEISGGPVPVTELKQALPLADGDVDDYEVNGGSREHEYQLVDADFFVTGWPFHIGTLDSLDGTRLILSFANPTRTGRTVGIDETGLQTDRIFAGQWVWVAAAGGPGWVGRVRTVTANAQPTKHTLALWWKIPTTYTVTTSSPVYRVSEAWAMRFLATHSSGPWLLFGANDSTGVARHTCEVIVLQGDSSEMKEQTERRDLRLDRYTMKFRGLLKSKEGLTRVTT